MFGKKKKTIESTKSIEPVTPTLAQRIFEGEKSTSNLENNFFTLLSENDCEWDFGFRFDWYDASVEIDDAPVDFRFTDSMFKLFMNAGFAVVYVNHIDGWETHYSQGHPEGWRVRYQGKSPSGNIEVEKPVEGWPIDWTKSEYVKVVDTSLENSDNEKENIMGWWKIKDVEHGQIDWNQLDKKEDDLINATHSKDNPDSLYNGDGPSDVMGDAFDEINQLYQNTWDRDVTVNELKAIFNFVLNGYIREEKDE